MQYSSRLESIKFFYDNGEAAEPAAMLGCDSSSDATPTFALDGAGGEHLDSIEVGIRRNDTPYRAYSFVKHGYIVSVKVYPARFSLLHCGHLTDYGGIIQMITNRGRSCATGNASKQDGIHQMKIAEGTTITGLYASKVCLALAPLTCGRAH